MDAAQKLYLRGRAVRVRTWQEREKDIEMKAEQKRIQAELAAFSDSFHDFALSPEGQKAAAIVVW